MTDAKLRFVLGAIDPEMLFIQRALAAAGLPWEWACPRASGRHGQPIRRHTAAYDCENVGLPERGLIRVWVECRPGGLPAGFAGCRALESRGDVVVDHHQPGDPGYRREAAEAFEGSSIGQLRSWSETWRLSPEHDHHAEAIGKLHAALSTPEARAMGAADHAPRDAAAGLVPRVTPEDVLALACANAADQELAALLGMSEPEAKSPEAARELILGAQQALRNATTLALGDVVVCDLLGPAGNLPMLPVAAELVGLAYVAEDPPRLGAPPTCSIGGAATARAVLAFAEIGRECFASTLATMREHAAYEAETVIRLGSVLTPDGRCGAVCDERGRGPERETQVRIDGAEMAPWFRTSTLVPVPRAGTAVVLPDGSFAWLAHVEGGTAHLSLTRGGRSVATEGVSSLRPRRYADTVRSMEACASRGAAQGGVCASPERGTGSVYLPASAFASWLRSPIERAFASLLTGAAYEAARQYACDTPTDALGDEIRAARHAARDVAGYDRPAEDDRHARRRQRHSGPLPGER